MITTNPYSILAESVPSIALQIFVIVMIIFVVAGTLLDILHKKNVKYFFNNAKKAKKNAQRELGSGERAAIIAKTIVHDIGTTAELGMGKRRAAHVLGMYGTILFWIGSAVMIFFYSSAGVETPTVWPIIWHVGAIMTCLGGFWFWLFLRVDVSSEANSVFRIISADLFVLALLASSTFGLIWSFLQTAGISGWDTLFLILFAVSNIVLFGGVYWSKFAHMFYKPGAAIQKNLAEADGSRDNLPPPADEPEQFGLGIKREAPKHY
ncbi:MAG: adenylyl-sulfate reductase [Candidatus Pelagibacter sp.]|nr:adenylyl-sulfate reductase [Candidatus Pelagibacter sp.]|tara:strand:+ start:292 stop:1086 length:795 start_codon:yes stop_codon:yes gene_type:complete